MNIRIDLEIKYSAENGSYFRVPLFMGDSPVQHLFFFFAMAKLISFTEDYIKKKYFQSI